MKAVVIGGSGATGKFLVERLLAADWITDVVVLLRRNAFPHNPKLTQIIVDFDCLEDWSSFITGDIAFSCMGTTLKQAGSKKAQWKVDYDYQYTFADIAARNKIPIFVLLSSQNADAGSFFFYMKMKGELEQNIEKLQFSKLIIHQPGMLIRPETERLGEKIGLKVLTFLNNIGLFIRLAPTHVSVIACAMLNSVKTAQARVTKLNVEDIIRISK